jgi:polyisoprenoid-binding protein YceI
MALMKKLTHAIVCASLLVFILGSTSTPALSNSNSNGEATQSSQPNLEDTYTNLGKADGKVYVFNPKTSLIKIYAFRGGAAPSLGHNHVLSTSNFTGFVYLPSKGILKSRFDLSFRLDQLQIDNSAESTKLGEAFANRLDTDGIKHTLEHMLGDDNLQADRFPFVRIHSVHVAGEIPKLAVEVQIELHGQQQTQTIPLNVEVLPERLTVSGSFVLRQSDFGVKPYSVLGGFLAVQDEVVIEFTLSGS